MYIYHKYIYIYIYTYLNLHVPGKGTISVALSQFRPLSVRSRTRKRESCVFSDGLQWVFTAWSKSCDSCSCPSICHTSLRSDSWMVFDPKNAVIVPTTFKVSILLGVLVLPFNWNNTRPSCVCAPLIAGLLWRVLPRQINGCCKYGLPFAGTGQSSMSMFNCQCSVVTVVVLYDFGIPIVKTDVIPAPS